jgi:hypothetical protein
LEVSVEEQIECAGVWKLGRLAEAAVLRIEHIADALHDALHRFFVGRARTFLKALHLTEGFRNLRRAVVDLLAVRPVVVRDGFQQALHARATGAVVGRKIGAAVKRLTVRREKRRERPTALAGQGAHRRLVARIDVGAFVPIDLHRNERFVDDARHFCILVTLAVHHMAPVAPNGADVEQDGFVLLARLRESGVAPLPPLDGLMRGGAQVGARGLCEFVAGVLRAHGTFSLAWRFNFRDRGKQLRRARTCGCA